ncbi:hypothetical protein TOPH_00749, partial [Tolypocladium ophioglossoides CBS 100239]
AVTQQSSHLSPSHHTRRLQDALPRRRPHDDLARHPTRLPRHPGSHVLAVPLPRRPLQQHPLQPAQQVVRPWLLVLHGHRLPRPVRHRCVPDLQGAVSLLFEAWISGLVNEGIERILGDNCCGTPIEARTVGRITVNKVSFVDPSIFAVATWVHIACVSCLFRDVAPRAVHSTNGIIWWTQRPRGILYVTLLIHTCTATVNSITARSHPSYSSDAWCRPICPREISYPCLARYCRKWRA